MRSRARIAVPLASLLMVVGAGHVVPTGSAPLVEASARPLPLAQASVTVPEAVGPAEPVVLTDSPAGETRAVSESGGAVRSTETLRTEVLNAYTQAVALAPASCHLSLSLLAAIGQVESGNLATSTITNNRVVPGILGPVLDGRGFARIPDTDDGRWDGNTSWDRALGPMQFVPASWRVVGLDLDDDGIRDPQNVFDAAGAAMVYLCSGGRDLSSPTELDEAILAYNRSTEYLDLVLAWQTVFDTADLAGVGSTPAPGAWAMPASPSSSASAAPGARVESSPKTSARTRPAAKTKAPRSSTSASAAPSGSVGTGTGTGAGAGTGTGTGTGVAPGPSTDPTPGEGPKTPPKNEPKGSPTTDPTPGSDPDVPPDSCLIDDDPTLEPGVEPEPEPEPLPEPLPEPTDLPSTPEDGTVPDPCDPLVPDEPAPGPAASGSPTVE